jgi:hypothetical protein
MKNLKYIIIILTLSLVTIIINSFITRDIYFFLYTEDEVKDEIEVQVLINNKKEFSGLVGYQIFGYKKFKSELTGGFHDLQILSNNEVILKKNIFIFLGRYYSIVFWDISKLEIEVNSHIRRFYFE